MLTDNVLIYGKHAVYMKELSSKFNANMNQGIFQRNLDVYVMAPIVGKLYNRKTERDKTIDESTSIHLPQLQKMEKEIMESYKTILLLENAESLSAKERLEQYCKAMEDEEERKKCDKLFESYVLGGIEVLHEKLMDGATNLDDYVEKLFYFLDDFNNHYKDKIDLDELENLCISIRK